MELKPDINFIKINTGMSNDVSVYSVNVREENVGLRYELLVDQTQDDYIFKVFRDKVLYIYGTHKTSDYPSENKDGNICEHDPFLKEEHFGPIYGKYKIKSNKVYRFGESHIVSTDFDIDIEVENKVKEIIIEEFKNSYL